MHLIYQIINFLLNIYQFNFKNDSIQNVEKREFYRRGFV